MHYPIIALMRGSRYQAGPKGRSLEVGARRAPRLLVYDNFKTPPPCIN